jgi:hypothetical protein
MTGRLLLFVQDKKQKSACHPRVVWMVLVVDGSTAELTILWRSKFVVGCYVINCAIYLARLIEHLL